MGYHQKVLLYPEATVERETPINVKESDAHLFSHEYHREFHETYGHMYQNVFVSGSGSTYHFENILLRTIPQSRSSEVATYKDFLKSWAHHVCQRTYLRVPQGLMVSDENSLGYFHWISDMLPKILSVSSDFFNECTLLIPEKFSSPILLDTLKSLDIEDAQVLVIPRHKKVLVDTLYCVGALCPPAGSGNYRPEIMQKLRHTVTSKTDSAQCSETLSRYGKKLYVSRSDARYRYMANEDEIVSVLKEHGFSVVVGSTLTFVEQVLLFSRAHVILGMHGAGLTNMMWLAPHSVVAEIRLAHDSHNNCYFSLASALQLRYYYVCATSTQHDAHTANFYLLKQDLLHLLQELHNA